LKSDADFDIKKKTKQILELEEQQRQGDLKNLSLIENLEQVNVNLKEIRVSSESCISELSKELRQLKIDNEKLKKRQEQLLQFRSVIAKTLGMDCSTTTIEVEYNIISFIERLCVQNNVIQTAATTSSTSQQIAVADNNNNNCHKNHHHHKHHHHHQN
jgi:hypothetical protein